MKKITVSAISFVLVMAVAIGLMVIETGNEEADELLSTFYNLSEQVRRPTSVRDVSVSAEGTDGDEEKEGDSETVPGIPTDLIRLCTMSDEEAWNIATNGRFSNRPQDSFESIKSQIEAIKAEMATTIEVNVWELQNGAKVAGKHTITCNKLVAPLFKAAVEDCFNLDSKPLMRITCDYQVRSVSGGAKASAHAFGCAIDINAVNTYGGLGNDYGDNIPTYEQWLTFPEGENKERIFYYDCPVVKIFKSYGFCWGGDFNTKKDGMHFSFIGDWGSNARSGYGIPNYEKYSKERGQ